MARVIEAKRIAVASKPRNAGFNSMSTGRVSMLAVNIVWEEACLHCATRKPCFISNQRTRLFLLASFGVAPFTGATPFP